MLDAIDFANAGLRAASLRLAHAARAVAESGATQAASQSPLEDGALTTSAAGGAQASDSALDALVDLMAAEAAYKANLATLRTASDMLQSLYKAID